MYRSLALNYFEYADPYAEMWSESIFNPESSVYNHTLASSYEVDNSTCIYDTNETCQSFHFPAGWSMFSTYIQAENMHPKTVLDEFYSGCNIVIIKDIAGSPCLCGWTWCSLIELNNVEGYQIKLSEAQSIDICGEQQAPELTPLTINSGWNIISYLRTTPQDIIEAFDEIIEEIIIVKDENGMVYLPSWDYNGIGDLEPGKGYQIKMNSEQTLIYDANED